MLNRYNVLFLCFGADASFGPGSSSDTVPSLSLNANSYEANPHLPSASLDTTACPATSGPSAPATAPVSYSFAQETVEETGEERGKASVPGVSSGSVPQPSAAWEEGTEESPNQDPRRRVFSSAASPNASVKPVPSTERTRANDFLPSSATSWDVGRRNHETSCGYSRDEESTVSLDEPFRDFSSPSRLFSLSAPLTPLPVLVDPADLTRHHICLGAPSLLSVSDALSYIPTLTVLEAVGGTALFDAAAKDRTPIPSSDASCGYRGENGAEHPIRTPNRYSLVGERVGSHAEANGMARATNLSGCSFSNVEQSPAETLGEKEGKLSAYLVVDPVYSVVMPEPCSLIANLDYICNLVQVILLQRLRLLSPVSDGSAHILRTRWKPASLWEAGNVSSELSRFSNQKKPEGLTGSKLARCHSDRGNANGEDSVSVSTALSQVTRHGCGKETVRPRFLTFVDRFASLGSEEIKALPPREYLKATVIPVLLPAIESVTRDRPEDPVSWIAFYLLRHATRFNRTEKQVGRDHPELFRLFTSLASGSERPRETSPSLPRKGSGGSSVLSSSHASAARSESTADGVKPT
ncbi:putative Dpy-30 motif containing protein [Neospora caninum Liverpool]|nr:putative Dpy-30 motif containing protein [Neospora caninum Liverpool]CBZ53720.1 putative Dpy-30 motif containing protein [Neospora caninum Liverpool]|eukprot:XP_003883752.1 putative Dpy-30 motif containing protein [Neospora caninum Liverpool]